MNSIVCVFEGFSIILFCLVQLNISCRYACTCCLVVFTFSWVERIVMSSSYIISFILFGGVWMSDVYTLSSVGESIPPCRTPVFIVDCFDFVWLYCFRPRM